MKKLLLLTLSCMCFVLLCGAARGQTDITGTYQGTLAVGKGLRLVFKIAKAPDGTLKGSAFSVDQGGAQLPVKSTTLTGGTLKVDLSPMGASYVGKVSPDGNTITGTYTQGQDFPMVLTRATAATAWVIPEAPKPVPPMATDADPAFDVSTVKPSDPDTKGKGLVLTPSGSLRVVNTSLAYMIEFAYNVQAKQLVGAPEWMFTDNFDVSGKSDTPGMPNMKQARSALQKLLVERFGLKFHREPKEIAAYVLTAPKGAARLTKSDAASDLPGLGFGISNGVTVNVHNAKITDFTSLLQSNVVDRPVVDKTGIEGRFDFKLSFQPDDSMMGGLGLKIPPTPEGKEAPPGLFTAVQDQLGMKLSAEKTQVSALVIDHVNKPSDN